MKTIQYNPSPIEVAFAKVVLELREEIQQKMPDFEIVEVINNNTIDNPNLLFTLVDKDGDRHELMIQFIQRADQ